MKRKTHRFRLYDKVLILDDYHFKDFNGMVVRKEPAEPAEREKKGLAVMVGEEEDAAMGLGPCRVFERKVLKYLGKNLKKRVMRTKQYSGSVGMTFYGGSF